MIFRKCNMHAAKFSSEIARNLIFCHNGLLSPYILFNFKSFLLRATPSIVSNSASQKAHGEPAITADICTPLLVNNLGIISLLFGTILFVFCQLQRLILLFVFVFFFGRSCVRCSKLNERTFSPNSWDMTFIHENNSSILSTTFRGGFQA